MKNSHEKVFTYSGFFTIGIVYFLLLIILIASFIIAKFEVGLFIGLLCALTIVCGLVALIVYLCSRHVVSENKKTKEKLDNDELNKPKRGKF